MAQNDSGIIDQESDEKKLRSKKFNKFLGDNFNLITIGVVLVIFIVGFFVLLIPKYIQTVNYLNSVNAEQVLNASSKQDELVKIQQLLASYNKIDGREIAKVNAVVPAIQNKEELFSELNYLVSVNQLFLQSISLSSTPGYADQGLVNISPDEIGIVDGIQTANIVLSVSGTNYESFKNLLTALENNLRLMDVLSINFDPASQSTTLIVNTYYSKN